MMTRGYLWIKLCVFCGTQRLDELLDCLDKDTEEDEVVESDI